MVNCFSIVKLIQYDVLYSKSSLKLKILKLKLIMSKKQLIIIEYSLYVCLMHLSLLHGWI